jgi:putative ABC transport system permease protein
MRAAIGWRCRQEPTQGGGRAAEGPLPSAGWSSRTAEDAASGLKRGIAQLGQFLLLVGLAALAIAGDRGRAAGVAAYLEGKTRMIATLKVLGARSARLRGCS